MKNILKALFVFVILLSISAQSNFSRKQDSTGKDSLKVLMPEDYQKRSEQLITTLLSRYHYKKINVNDSLSSTIFNNYFKALDYGHYYFLQSDVKNFERYRYELDDDIKIARLIPAFDIYNTFLDRVRGRWTKIQAVLDKGFDFTTQEEFLIDRKDVPWAKTDAELDEVWEKRLKNEALSLKLAGKDDKSIKETLLKRYSNFQKRINQTNSEDVFQLFMNQFAQSIDPHTDYFSPKTSEDFKINMSLSLEGIGATLGQEDDYTKVVELVVGGPAYKSKKIAKGDRIVGVAQGDNGEMVDVIGWRLDDVVKLIRGPKGTIVRLQILSADAGVGSIPKEIMIERDRVKLEEQAAKKEIIETNLNGIPFKLGVIKLPAFYLDFDAQQRGDKDYKSTTRDVRRLIKELQEAKVDGLIIDLRNNGGGSLQEAIDLTGLFIKDGPVVQVRSSDGKVEVASDSDPDIVYDGPLAVMVNRFSASASEIFAGAIQDYERGLIIGETTYGKGTVQNLIDLNRFNQGGEKLGQLKITIAKFYRIDGESTQHKGVVPDIRFPSAIDTTEYGESSEPSALPWDQISSTKYNIYTNLKKFLPKLNNDFDARKKKDPEFKDFISDIQEYKTEHDKKVVSLNEAVRKKEYEEAEAKKKKSSLTGDDELDLVANNEVNVPEKKNSDILLKETANILADMINMITLSQR